MLTSRQGWCSFEAFATRQTLFRERSSIFGLQVVPLDLPCNKIPPPFADTKESVMKMSSDKTELMERAADVIAAYVSNNSVAASQLPDLIASVHAALLNLSAPQPESEDEPLKPAVPVKKSVTPDFIICLEDGLKFKSLKRHLRIKYDTTPEEYRAKWGLPNDYPMVAPSYAEARSALAKQMGLGQQRKKPVTPAKPRSKAAKPKSAAAVN